MRITRFGHAALLIETSSTRVLIDPGVFCPEETFDLTELDAVVVTHQHPDHLDPERVVRLLDANPGALLLCDPETADGVDVGDWTANSDGHEERAGDLTIRGVGARHAVILPEIPRIANVGVVVTDPDGTTLFHPGDTYEYVPEGVDVLAVPLSAPWAKISETVAFAQAVAPRVALPIHDKTISELAYPLYWNQVVQHGGADDPRRLGQRDSTQV